MKNKIRILLVDSDKEQVVYNKLYTDINAFCANEAFNKCPIYELKSKKLSDGFKKLKF